MRELNDLVHDTDRAVSPVIGVILMVAITVILAAVIGTFVLDLGSNTKQNPQAGVSFEQTGSSTLQITITSLPRASDLTPESTNGNCNDWGTVAVGETTTCSSLSSGNTIRIIGTYNGQKAVIASYEF